MTINGIWEWANHVSQKVAVETLRGKVLAIDGHIWLYESLKGCETHHQQTPNSYLITFFTRIQRLRELKITPIVVFDSISTSSPAHEGADQKEFVPRKRRNFGDSLFTNLADPVYKTNMLLSQMGVKVIISPGDGEAQCARLEELEVTSGCITTDFDYFLFGGKNLYRFDFTASGNVALLHDVVHLSLGRMNIEKKVDRPHLISTAILLGCDYFQRGVQNIGIVTVFDILAEFGDDGNEDVDPHVILDRFYSYVKEEIPARSEDSSRKLRLRRKKFNFPQGFPNCQAVENAVKMYLQPSVYHTMPQSSAAPSPVSMEKIELILKKECGWSPERLQKELSTSERRTRNITNTVTQPRINEFFNSTKMKSFSPIVEPCDSLDDYISSNNNWVKKRKRTGESPKVTPQRKRSAKVCIPHKPNHHGVITLDDSD
ncbi:hypothetical protein L5515_003426 [Caenorhabditis briggsae]|uniref:Protein CBR-GEN-1 n=2 Tax=Caenorhabditis briggsae TaxID=6238 RepID=A0AAE9JAE1_CAEBR|nr:hypothetical protein L5515_003426 [Caenorhabditis briggsae]